MIKTIAAIFLSMLVVGCAAPHDCKLGYKCNNAIDALEAARDNGGNSETVMPKDGGYEKIDSGEGSSSKKKGNKLGEEKGRILTMGKTVLRGQPVYIPDSPLRVTVMPIMTDDVLIGAHEIYFTVPGGYSMGIDETRSRGGSLGIFGPLDRNKNLGFTPDFTDSRASRVEPQN